MHRAVSVPQRLVENCRRSAEGRAWLGRLPETIAELSTRWSLAVGPPFDGPEVSASWVAPVRGVDLKPSVLKIGLPHMEGEQEIDGLRFWDGDPTVRLLEADDQRNAMLLERCEPGTNLRELPEEEQDVVLAGLLRRLWRSPAPPHPFRPLTEMIGAWIGETVADEERWPDPPLIVEGLGMLEALSRDSDGEVLLGTDVHAGNVLRAERGAWLVIDPKPFVGDPTFDATQHLRNCMGRLRKDGRGTIARFSDLLQLDTERVRLWAFARAAAESRDDWDDEWFEIARILAP
jgi:streptomycin 6-kinase